MLNRFPPAPAQRVGPGWLFAVLATVLFIYLTAELFTVGALPQMSEDLGVTSGQVGQLLTVYAVVAAITIVPAAWATRRIDQRILLSLALVLLGVASLVVAAAPNIAVVAAARGVVAIAHGVVWAGVPVVAARIAGPGNAARATSLVFLGSSIGGLAGAPVVAAISQLASWRLASALLAAAAFACAVVLVKALPDLPRQKHRTHTSTPPGGGGARPVAAVAVWCVLTVLVTGAHHMVYPYLSVIAASWGVHDAGWVLFLLTFSAAGVAGTMVMGRFNDRAPFLTVTICLVVLTGSLLGAAVTGTVVLAAVSCLLWSASYAMAPVAFQGGVIRDARGWSEAASSVYVLTFQIGIAAGTWWGGRAVDAHGASTALWWAGTACTIALLTVLLVVVARPRRHTPGHQSPDDQHGTDRTACPSAP